MRTSIAAVTALAGALLVMPVTQGPASAAPNAAKNLIGTANTDSVELVRMGGGGGVGMGGGGGGGHGGGFGRGGGGPSLGAGPRGGGNFAGRTYRRSPILCNPRL
jgi:hypothetical protein